MPSESAPSLSFDERELARLRELRRAFLREHGVTPQSKESQED
jgi:hypothetical protein